MPVKATHSLRVVQANIQQIDSIIEEAQKMLVEKHSVLAIRKFKYALELMGTETKDERELERIGIILGGLSWGHIKRAMTLNSNRSMKAKDHIGYAEEYLTKAEGYLSKTIEGSSGISYEARRQQLESHHLVIEYERNDIMGWQNRAGAVQLLERFDDIRCRINRNHSDVDNSTAITITDETVEIVEHYIMKLKKTIHSLYIAT
jgi:hypothetical protein